MKTKGIIRKVDEVGRIIIPSEIRSVLNIDYRDQVEVFLDNNSMIVKKYVPTCIFCGETKNISVFKDKQVCARCLKELSKLNEKE